MPWWGRKAYREPIATSAPEFQIRRAQAQDAPACARLQATDPDAPWLDDRAGAMIRSLAHRRRGIGRALIRTRLIHAFGDQNADRVWYFTNANNTASIALHNKFGFVEVERPMRAAPISFEGGVGVLFMLSCETWTAETERA